MLSIILMVVQLISTGVITFYFLNQLRHQNNAKQASLDDSETELQKLRRLREVKLTEPLSERNRPKAVSDIVGQKEGIRALRAALCSANPQHVLIYGPPGVGKTAAARVILEEAKKISACPFGEDAKFVEMDATVLRFDERNIADPLIGSVHDPIYQGAGAYGHAGVPQPKPGAVTRAHGGVLFLDEIGELHPLQMNKLLKVLEDRKVFLESAYYRPGDQNTPRFVHDVFTNGLPADFRLIGATTRRPEELPEALRSRCVEIFFHTLTYNEILSIVNKAVKRSGCHIEEGGKELIAHYAQNGRDAANILQTAMAVSSLEGRSILQKSDIEWVTREGKYIPRLEKKVGKDARIGVVNGLAVNGSEGTLMEIEATALYCGAGKGSFQITGIVEEEIIKGNTHELRRRSTASNSADVMRTLLRQKFCIGTDDYDIHVHIPGGIPVDGPSAGTAILTAVYSAITKQEISPEIALTGEISITGEVLMVGGVPQKVVAAERAGVKTVYIPKGNGLSWFQKLPIEVCSVDTVEALFDAIFEEQPKGASRTDENLKVLTASGA